MKKDINAYITGATLKLSIKNSKKFQELLNDVHEKSKELEDSLDRLSKFYFDVEINVSDD